MEDIFKYVFPIVMAVLNIILWYQLKKSKAEADILKTKAETRGVEATTKKTTVETLAVTVDILSDENVILRERLKTNELKMLVLENNFKIMVDGVKKLVSQVKRLDPKAEPDFTVPSFQT